MSHNPKDPPTEEFLSMLRSKYSEKLLEFTDAYCCVICAEGTTKHKYPMCTSCLERFEQIPHRSEWTAPEAYPADDEPRRRAIFEFNNESGQWEMVKWLEHDVNEDVCQQCGLTRGEHKGYPTASEPWHTFVRKLD